VLVIVYNILVNLKYLSITSGVMLILAILNLPYGYYTFLRLGITISAGIFTYYFYESKETIWTVVFGAIALLFNPIVPVYLDKSTWVLIDIVTAIVFFYSSTKKHD